MLNTAFSRVKIDAHGRIVIGEGTIFKEVGGDFGQVSL